MSGYGRLSVEKYVGELAELRAKETDDGTKLEAAIRCLRLIDYACGEPKANDISEATNEIGIIACDFLDAFVGHDWEEMDKAEGQWLLELLDDD